MPDTIHAGTVTFPAGRHFSQLRKPADGGLAHPLLLQRVIVPEILVLGAKQVIPLP